MVKRESERQTLPYLEPIIVLTKTDLTDNFGVQKAKKKFIDMQDGDVLSTYANIDDMTKDFEYKAKTKLDEGIEEFIKWYNNFYIK